MNETDLDGRIESLEETLARVRQLRTWLEADPVVRDLVDPGELAELTRRGLHLAPGVARAAL